VIDDEYLSLELNDKRRWWWCVVVMVMVTVTVLIELSVIHVERVTKGDHNTKTPRGGLKPDRREALCPRGS